MPPAAKPTAATGRVQPIDELRSARVRRETYVGERLPEPLITSDEYDPPRHAEIADSLSLAFLVLLAGDGDLETLESCSQRTSSCTATAAVECPRSPAPCTAGAG